MDYLLTSHRNLLGKQNLRPCCIPLYQYRHFNCPGWFFSTLKSKMNWSHAKAQTIWDTSPATFMVPQTPCIVSSISAFTHSISFAIFYHHPLLSLLHMSFYSSIKTIIWYFLLVFPKKKMESFPCDSASACAHLHTLHQPVYTWLHVTYLSHQAWSCFTLFHGYLLSTRQSTRTEDVFIHLCIFSM